MKWETVDDDTEAFNTATGVIIKYSELNQLPQTEANTLLDPEPHIAVSITFIPGEHWKRHAGFYAIESDR